MQLYHHLVRKLLLVIVDLLSEVVPELGKPWCLVHRAWKGLYPDYEALDIMVSGVEWLGETGRQ